MSSGKVVEASSDNSTLSENVWQSGIKLTECRFLAASKCKAACVHLCKVPCQTLFQEQLGIPLYMQPNYEDYSCTFHFGVPAPSLDEDPALNKPCFSDCGVVARKSNGSTCV